MRSLLKAFAYSATTPRRRDAIVVMMSRHLWLAGRGLGPVDTTLPAAQFERSARVPTRPCSSP